jgi:uncharacterized protein
MTNSRCLIVLVALILLSGCIGGVTKPSSFYSLSATEANQSKNIVRTTGIGLRLGPFTFPDYLSRPNIITRQSDNKIVVNEFQRWAGSLEDDFHRTLGINLGALLKSSNISVYPADTRMSAKYKVVGEINAFDGYLGKKAILDIRWFVLDPGGNKTYSTKQSVIVEPVADSGYATLVMAQSRAVGRLSREIADELRRLEAAN